MATKKFFGSILMLILAVGAVSALFNLPQKPLPSGGSSFENAVEIQAGSYGGELGVTLPSSVDVQESTQYFYIKDLKKGQEVTVKGTFTGKTAVGSSVTLGLYDQDRKELDKNGVAAYGTAASINLVGLGNSEKYYVTVKVDGPAAYAIDISVLDKYDANSKTDAGDSFEDAMSITPGGYVGYLAGGKGNDVVDTFKVPAKKGRLLNTEVTTKSNAAIKVGIYDINKKLIDEKTALNPGATVMNSVGITRDEDVFVVVSCDGGCSSGVVEYTLSFPSSQGVGGATKQGESKSLLTWLMGLNWLLIIEVIIGLIVLFILALVVIYLLFFRKKKWDEYKPDYASGSGGVTETIVGYKHPCRYCDKMIPPNSNVCPECGKMNPLGPIRCPKCRNPVQKNWQKCSGCGLSLTISCPRCSQTTFFGDYCEKCGEELKVTCPNCKAKQPPVGEKCVRCGKKLK